MRLALLMITVSVLPLARAAAADDFVVVDRGFDTRVIDVVALDDAEVTWVDERGQARSIPLEQCIALIGTRPYPTGDEQVVVLADGQRLVGKPNTSAEGDSDALSWRHPWLGKIEVPLDTIAAVRFLRGAELPESGESDVVVLTNGDRLEGFIVGLGATIALEIESVDENGRPSPRVVEIPMERVSSVALVAPPIEGRDRRVWFDEGTVVDARSFRVTDDGAVRFTTTWTNDETKVSLSHLAAIHLDRAAMVPLNRCTRLSVEGTTPRYIVPSPADLEPSAPLGLGALELRGPLVVRYAIPEGARRFAAEASLPETARTWGDFEVVIRVDDVEIYREHFDRDTPESRINVPLDGAELAIELTPGKHGPIQDRLHLVRAMVLLGGER